MSVDKLFHYKGYHGTANFSEEDRCFYGKVTNTKDLILFEGETISELYEAFTEAVDEHIENRT